MSKKSGKVTVGQGRANHVATSTAPALTGRERLRVISPPPGRKKRQQQSNSIVYSGAAGLAMGIIMIALSLISVGISTQAPPVGATPVQSTDNSIGSASAPVVITEWVDFQCPACRLYALSREPEIVKKYVDTGQVRIVSRNLAFLGQESIAAAEAADAAAAQGRYWDYKTLLFQRQNGENRGTFNTDALKRFAGELGLNQQAFNSALDNGTYRSAVQAEAKEGRAQGIDATPTVIVNGQKLAGVPTVDEVSKAIELELAKKK